MQSWENPLTWGMTKEDYEKTWPDANFYYYPNKIYANKPGKTDMPDVILQNFQGDCGSLILQKANYATKESLAFAREIASKNGFNKIFATVVGKPNMIENAVKAFKQNRWITVTKGHSNRNKQKEDYIFVLYIRNCHYKGY